jgi:ribonucleoside-triphosphate reductase
MVDEPNSTRPEAQATSETMTGRDVELFVRGSDENVVRFDPQRIIDALVREANLDVDIAAKISLDIKGIIARSGIRALSSSLIRELVDAKLIEYGLESAHRAHARLGVPLYDAERIIRQGGRDVSAYPQGPEGTSLTLAEAIKREYAMIAVFSEEVAQAHLSGDIHIQGIGTFDDATDHAGVGFKGWGMGAAPPAYTSTRQARGIG